MHAKQNKQAVIYNIKDNLVPSMESKKPLHSPLQTICKIMSMTTFYIHCLLGRFHTILFLTIFEIFKYYNLLKFIAIK